jgi:hypothetical protein
MLDPVRALHPAVQAKIDRHGSVRILHARRTQRFRLFFRHCLQR